MRTGRVGWLLAALALGAMACGSGRPRPGGGGGRGDGGPGSDGGGIGEDGGPPPPPPGGYAVFRGTVWAPGNAPGMVPAGQEIPVAGAVVEVVASRPAAIPEGVYCEPCQEASAGAVTTDAKGNFVLGTLLPGDYWLVIRKGQFRLERQVTIAEGEERALPAEWTTLPSEHDPANGQWVPRIAVATGDYDELEDVLGKMGIGGVSSEGQWRSGPGADRIDFYTNGGRTDVPVAGTFGELVRDRARLMQYHIIFVPCSGDSHTSALRDEQVLRNLQAYVAEGGKLYVTDWSGEWHDNVFPAFVRLADEAGFGGDQVDTPPEAFDPGMFGTLDDDSWNPSRFGTADGDSYDADDAEAEDEMLRTWLDGQQAPDPEGSGAVGTVDATNFPAVDNWNTILELPDVQVGVGDDGLPAYERAKAWVIGTSPLASGKKPMTVTYEPTGCGRVLFTTYHTTGRTHVGLTPQERILLYLIMEIGVCKSGPILR